MNLTNLMKRLSTLTLFTFALIFLAGKAKAQPSQAAQSTPNCVLYFSFTVAGQSTPALANYGAGSVNGPNVCDTWTLGYSNVGFSAISLVIQNAPAATTTTPGSWVSYAGTIDVGVNPNTSTTGAQTKMHNGAVGISWIRVTLASATGSGTVFGVLQGWNSGSGGTTGGGGGGGSTACPNPCPVEGAGTAGSPPVGGPVLTGRTDGTNLQTDFVCDSQATITVSSASSVQILAGTAAEKIRICHISLGISTATTMQIEEGTGSICASGTAGMTGTYQNVATIALDFTPSAALITQTAADNVCLAFGASITAGGVVVYAKY